MCKIPRRANLQCVYLSVHLRELWGVSGTGLRQKLPVLFLINQAGLWSSYLGHLFLSMTSFCLSVSVFKLSCVSSQGIVAEVKGTRKTIYDPVHQT